MDGMLQQDLLPPPDAQEPRSKRCLFEIPACLHRRMLELAAEFGVSTNEILVQCLLHGLADELVLRFIERCASHRRELGGRQIIVENTTTTKGQFLIPASVKLRLKEIKAQHDLPLTETVLRCLQYGLFDHLVVHRIRHLAASRTKKLGRTVRKEDLHRAA
jgi:hypothetical protein